MSLQVAPVVTYKQRAGAGAGPHTRLHDWCGLPDVSHIGLAVDTGDSGSCRCCSSSICFTGSVLDYVYQEFASLLALDLLLLRMNVIATLYVVVWLLCAGEGVIIIQFPICTFAVLLVSETASCSCCPGVCWALWCWWPCLKWTTSSSITGFCLKLILYRE